MSGTCYIRASHILETKLHCINLLAGMLVDKQSGRTEDDTNKGFAIGMVTVMTRMTLMSTCKTVMHSFVKVVVRSFIVMMIIMVIVTIIAISVERQ